MDVAAYEIVERDEAGVEVRRYVGDAGARVDVIVSCDFHVVWWVEC